jgi:hypothetical protein
MHIYIFISYASSRQSQELFVYFATRVRTGKTRNRTEPNRHWVDSLLGWNQCGKTRTGTDPNRLISRRIFDVIISSTIVTLFDFWVTKISVESYWLTKEWIATAVSLKWTRNSAHYIENLSHSSIYWFSSSDSSRFIWGPRSSFVTRIFSSDQVIFVLRCHFDLISSESHIHLRTHWSLDDLENQ